MRLSASIEIKHYTTGIELVTSVQDASTAYYRTETDVPMDTVSNELMESLNYILVKSSKLMKDADHRHNSMYLVIRGLEIDVESRQNLRNLYNEQGGYDNLTIVYRPMRTERMMNDVDSEKVY